VQEPELPVQLVSFVGAVLSSGHVRLDWRTLSEINNFGFNVERKRLTETHWDELPNSFVAGNGTTNEPHAYSFVDIAPPNGQLQYRLKQTDLNQSTHHSEPVQINSLMGVREVAPVVFTLMQNFPNPFNPETNIKFSVEALEHTTLEIYNMLGQKVATLFDDVAEPGYFYNVKFDGKNMSSGVYFYRLQSGKKTDLKKLLLLR
jgi:hypothetical protein